MLELQRVVKRYRSGGQDACAVNEVSLKLAAGEMLALQGPSGSGKTTLLLLAAAALQADAGSVLYQGREIGDYNEREAARYRLAEIGLVAQNAHLMARVPAVENTATKLLLGGVPLRQARDQAMEWLTRLGIVDIATRTPEQLSGGQRQLVAIARALAGEPRLILADEPTANLDSERSSQIAALLSQLAHEHGKAVLLVTHDPDAAAAADSVLSLRDGQLAPELIRASSDR
jgi:putative ABC transport system ATP-binding protein